jgi:rubrerythrin
MTSILFDSSRRSKPETFGRGTCRWVPAATGFVPTAADEAWAAQAFADAEADRENRHLEERAQSAARTDQFNAMLPQAGRCAVCGELCDYLEPTRRCPRCDRDAVEGSGTRRPHFPRTPR